jgi:hypothetical protein
MNTKTTKQRQQPCLARAIPVSEAERGRLRELHGAGLGCGQIAAEMSRNAGTISRHAAAMGLSFDRSKLKAATAARVADVAARRAEVSATFLTLVEKMSARMEAELDDDDAEVKPWRLRDFSYGIGAIFDRHLAAADHDAANESGSEVDAWLRQLTGQEPPVSRSDSDESAKSRSLLGTLMNDIVSRHGTEPTEGK